MFCPRIKWIHICLICYMRFVASTYFHRPYFIVGWGSCVSQYKNTTHVQRATRARDAVALSRSIIIIAWWRRQHRHRHTAHTRYKHNREYSRIYSCTASTLYVYMGVHMHIPHHHRRHHQHTHTQNVRAFSWALASLFAHRATPTPTTSTYNLYST